MVFMYQVHVEIKRKPRRLLIEYIVFEQVTNFKGDAAEILIKSSQFHL